MRRKGDCVDGVMLLDKPKAMSSNWALQLTRRLLNAQKAGHTGTLDPLATGLLPLAFGNATKYSADLLHADKRYLATVKFGFATNTMDAEGEIIASSGKLPTRQEIEAVIPEFTGSILQTPPMYSALKKDGKTLYALARQGISVEREARAVTVHSLEIKSFDGSCAVLDILVSKGTYIRVLADDIGRRLGVYGYLTDLRRTQVGHLRIEDAVDFSVLDDPSKTLGEKRALLRDTDFLLSSLPEVTLDQQQAQRLLNGQRLAVQATVRGKAKAFGPQKQLLGVVDVDDNGVIHPSRLITFVN